MSTNEPTYRSVFDADVAVGWAERSFDSRLDLGQFDQIVGATLW
jgi:hypothetical protein